MNTFIFYTDNAIFSFDLPEVFDLLASYSFKHYVKEATALFEY